MDTRTGRLVDAVKIQRMDESERKNFIEVKRDLTQVEKANREIRMYSLCGCGSGKKFKFCCFRRR
jgi:uncharacterized protein YchJ